MKINSRLILGLLLLSNSIFSQNLANHSVFFNTAQSEISPDEKLKLQNFIQKTDSLNEFEITINSYCDDRGNNEYNQKLSENRANSIKDFLLQQKIKENSITSVKANGEIQLEHSDFNIDEQRKHNRRADLVLIYKPRITEKIKDTASTKELFSDSMKVGDKFILDNILFEGGRTALLEESFAALNNLVLALKTKTQYSVCILGHVCCTSYGLDGLDHDTGKRNLSKARAQAIYSYLISKGITKSRLSYKGMKGNFPTGLGDKFDRRVELEIVRINNE
jgi:outer membrane protein OmpA-like peptidoglycan-associated protein